MLAGTYAFSGGYKYIGSKLDVMWELVISYENLREIFFCLENSCCCFLLASMCVLEWS